MLEEIQLQQVLPQEIEKRSFEIITEELGNVELDPLQAPIIKRAIHTSADFDYKKWSLYCHGYADGEIRHQQERTCEIRW